MLLASSGSDRSRAMSLRSSPALVDSPLYHEDGVFHGRRGPFSATTRGKHTASTLASRSSEGEVEHGLAAPGVSASDLATIPPTVTVLPSGSLIER